MKKKENTPQNPETENISIQEENSSSVIVTDLTIEQNLPTDQDQIEEQIQTEELTPNLRDESPKEPDGEPTDQVHSNVTIELEPKLQKIQPDTEVPEKQPEVVGDVATSAPAELEETVPETGSRARMRITSRRAKPGRSEVFFMIPAF